MKSILLRRSFITEAAVLLAAFVILSAFGAAPRAASGKEAWPPQDRWFYVVRGLESDAGTDGVIDLINRASSVGLNGMLWSADWDDADRWSEEKIARCQRVKEAADKADVEIIPILWTIGYGTMTGKNPNLAEGLPVKNLPMAVKDGKAVYLPERIKDVNGGMEEWKGENTLVGAVFHDKPGEISFRDDKVFHGGKSSLRMENFTADQYGHGRVLFEVDVEPYRVYRVTAWLKANDVHGQVMVQVNDMNGGQLSRYEARPNTEYGAFNSDWTKVTTSFRAPKDGKARLYAGVWDGGSGTLWIDDMQLEGVGLVNPLRRPGTPISVKSADGKTEYKEGKDWTLPEFRLRLWDPDAESQTLIIPEGSAIQDGQKLSVDFYYAPLVGAPQIGTCMSEPEVYEEFEKSAAAVVKLINPKKWFLSMDEIRCAGTCKACKDRGISLAAILGDCITKQRAIIKKARPDADVYIWSDMLDPNHNAHDNYYVCEGDYSGVWDLIPKDLVVACWYYEIRDKSMKFFSERGFRTLGAAYYDTAKLEDNCLGWIDTCQQTPGCVGIMYTTWQKRYELLEPFGKALQK